MAWINDTRQRLTAAGLDWVLLAVALALLAVYWFVPAPSFALSIPAVLLSGVVVARSLRRRWQARQVDETGGR